MKQQRPYVFMLLFVSAHFVHHLLTAIILPLLPMIRDSFELSYSQSGIVMSAFALSYGFSQLPAGWIADRIGSRYMLLIGISGVGIAGFLVGISTGYVSLLVLLVLLGLAGGAYHPSASPLISASVPETKRGKAIGLHIFGGSSSHLAAPLLAVFIAGFLGWRGSFLIISIPVIIIGAVLFILLNQYQVTARKVRDPADATGRQKLRLAPEIIIFLVATSALGASVGSMLPFVTLYIVDSFGFTEQVAALFLTLFYAVTVVSAPVGGLLADRLNIRVLFSVVALAAGPAVLLMGMAMHWVMIALLLFSLAVISSFRMIMSETFFVSRVPAAHRSTVLGIYFFAGAEASGIISPVLGAAIDQWGFTWAFGSLGIVLLIVASACMLLLSRFDRGMRHPRPEQAAAK